jgi:hypothetical protein
MCDGLLLLWLLVSEGGIQLILFDARRRVAALIKILLFGAIAHHAGMANVRFPFGGRRNRRYICDVRSPSGGPTRGGPCCHPGAAVADCGPAGLADMLLLLLAAIRLGGGVASY